MKQSLDDSQIQKINDKITDRHNVFYWQTDRAITPQEAGAIWADRHSYFSDQDIIEAVNAELADDKLVSLEPLDTEAQTSLVRQELSAFIDELLAGKKLDDRIWPSGTKQANR